MARGQHIGRIDIALLARVDAKANELGQTRKVFTERALEASLREYESGWPAVPASVPSRKPNPQSSSLRNFMPKAP